MLVVMVVAMIVLTVDVRSIGTGGHDAHRGIRLRV